MIELNEDELLSEYITNKEEVPEIAASKSSNKTNPVYDFYDEIFLEDGSRKYKCKTCKESICVRTKKVVKL